MDQRTRKARSPRTRAPFPPRRGRATIPVPRKPLRSWVAGLLLLLFFGAAFVAIGRRGMGEDGRSDLVRAFSAEYGVDAALVNAVIECESGGRVQAVSRAGAVGLMQVMPATARAVCAEIGLPAPSRLDLFDPEINIRVGTYYLAKMLRRFGDVHLALAAYNAGPGNVTRWMGEHPRLDGPGVVRRAAFGETRAYVDRVLKAWKGRS